MTLPERIAELIEQHGSARAVSRVLRIDAGYLSRLANGEKKDPGSAVLRKLGLVKVVTYQRKVKT